MYINILINAAPICYKLYCNLFITVAPRLTSRLYLNRATRFLKIYLLYNDEYNYCSVIERQS